MNKSRSFATKVGKLFASLALTIGISSVDSACYLFLHQPKVPAGMNKFKK